MFWGFGLSCSNISCTCEHVSKWEKQEYMFGSCTFLQQHFTVRPRFCVVAAQAPPCLEVANVLPHAPMCNNTRRNQQMKKKGNLCIKDPCHMDPSRQTGWAALPTASVCPPTWAGCPRGSPAWDSVATLPLGANSGGWILPSSLVRDPIQATGNKLRNCTRFILSFHQIPPRSVSIASCPQSSTYLIRADSG